jgi:hypothetical protein
MGTWAAVVWVYAWVLSNRLPDRQACGRGKAHRGSTEGRQLVADAEEPCGRVRKNQPCVEAWWGCPSSALGFGNRVDFLSHSGVGNHGQERALEQVARAWPDWQVRGWMVGGLEAGNWLTVPLLRSGPETLSLDPMHASPPRLGPRACGGFLA